MKFQEIQEKVKEILDKRRYEHTLRVMDTAAMLAERYNANVERAKLAALLHDVCKPMDEELMKKYVIKYGLDLKLLDYPTEVLHGPVASVYIEKEFKVVDEEVRMAVANHTFGRKHMSLLEKIIFIADYIEPERKHPHLKEVTEVARYDLDEAVRLAAKYTLVFLIDNDERIYPSLLKCYNYYNIKNYRVGFKEVNKDKILSGDKIITIRNNEEAHFKKGDTLEAVTYDDDTQTIFAKLEVDLVKRVDRYSLTERHASLYGVTKDELVKKLAERYPNDEELYVIMFHLIK
ncbi:MULTISPECIES: bis(5'-nucleosyl)-tetraphosphatase (symmetrical) YqeK [unclassified Gemella]|uniref:bis(5'-nucleosyl)-tetraphosphatase (symmetrical) YqeK n=1 Tax=unclassified Gemella TaxID=2624949 RepID=UPI0010733536|nr:MULTISPECIES: bis(5'-nucleosyl)-tetraphosphatase (symmetrical) YqeK [unclassified Gemella]MBF0710720.1 bis(5'-nucleosyl)-tetraphosphatase (symmetrical) YqeK [Gemella sp. GL1.1]MBF0746711.1 bis(5'-nucleosyl)-tetraphosphatase (symmetrical) YqeK [Gemella sp. 19428wG2_WT2a]NYS28064.1 bis(5'-nucleosyl)-tetraphosphatase (symmetrical) YqeK [Gemella sp. GL1]TFU60060.1 HD domain-containing protein [Gemella sp. WT2a]